MLVRATEQVGLDAALRDALRGWRRPTTIHDPGKVILDLALTLAIGGDCVADIAQLRASPAVFWRVASDATVSHAVAALASDADRVLAAISCAGPQLVPGRGSWLASGPRITARRRLGRW